MKDHATLSELVSGVRFIAALERTTGTVSNYFNYEMEKAEASSSPRELHLFAAYAIPHARNPVAVAALEAIKSMATKHPLYVREWAFVTDEDVAAYLMTIEPQSLKNLCRACDVLVDKDALDDSAKEVSVLSIARLMALMPDSEPDEFEGEDRLAVFQLAVHYFDVSRQQRKIDEFLSQSLNHKQRDALLASIGINIYDEDYEEDLEESRVSSELIVDELDTLQSNVDWVDWTDWKVSDPTLPVFEALVHAYEKLTPEISKARIKQLPNPNE